MVQEATREFADLFACEPQRRHLCEHLTGLMIAKRKSVSGINREFAETTDQSGLNRFLTVADWDVAELNERRLKWLQQSPDTR
jgi:SRSO17 transposase